jgi:hypothetical protein
MGWISKRFATQNRYKWGKPISQEKRRAPLRKIAYVIRHRTSLFDHDRVMLECGHEAVAFGEIRARCVRCLEEIERPSGIEPALPSTDPA